MKQTEIYKVTFYRFNTYVKPMMEASVDVVFCTDLSLEEGDIMPPSGKFEAVMWKAMWEQNPAWLMSHGPSTIGFQGWSSVMCKRESLMKVETVKRDMSEDLTGKGNMAVALTFHPLLPSDMRTALKKAYERGVATGGQCEENQDGED